MLLPVTSRAGLEKFMPGFSISSYGAGLSTQFRNPYIRDNRKAAPALRVALSLHYQVKPHLGLRTELGYSLKGRKYLLGTYEFHQQMHYTGIALLAEPSIGKKYRVVIPFGPAFNLLTKAKLKTPESLLPSADNTGDFKRFEAAWVAGLGLQIPMENFADFQIGFRNEIGLTGIYQNFSNPKTNPLHYQFTLTFNLLFHLKKKP